MSAPAEFHVITGDDWRRGLTAARKHRKADAERIRNFVTNHRNKTLLKMNTPEITEADIAFGARLMNAVGNRESLAVLVAGYRTKLTADAVTAVQERDTEIHRLNNALILAKQGAQPVEKSLDEEVGEIRTALDAKIKRDCGYTDAELVKKAEDSWNHPDTLRLDWLDENAGYIGGGNGGVYSFRTPADVESGMIRDAIDAARKEGGQS